MIDTYSTAKKNLKATEETSNVESGKSDGEKHLRKRRAKKYNDYVRSQSSTSENDQGKFHTSL